MTSIQEGGGSKGKDIYSVEHWQVLVVALVFHCQELQRLVRPDTHCGCCKMCHIHIADGPYLPFARRKHDASPA